ncbi:MAG: hypothetical protein C0616_05145 [Desulfuromonas sp.]|nr:MAG: hypothetical protein C0616_05145 [Desulfuromonas sp.]
MKNTLLVLVFLLAADLPNALAETRFNLRQGPTPEESILELLFGSPPPLATERGILVVNAFNDQDGNGHHDVGEESLDGQITCSLDGIDYTIPAFIPGLAYEADYRLECRGEHFKPGFSSEEIFIRKRGQIIHVALPCRKEPESETRPSS